jgi:hypothetical protein
MPEYDKAFYILKEKLSSAPILIFPNWEIEFHVHVDASCITLGSILAQPGEVNNARETLHKRTIECTKIFVEVSDWMGIISRCNHTLEDLHAKIQLFNVEATNTLDPLEWQAKFEKI